MQKKSSQILGWLPPRREHRPVSGSHLTEVPPQDSEVSPKPYSMSYYPAPYDNMKRGYKDSSTNISTVSVDHTGQNVIRRPSFESGRDLEMIAQNRDSWTRH